MSSRKRPRDPAQPAKLIVDLATADRAALNARPAFVRWHPSAGDGVKEQKMVREKNTTFIPWKVGFLWCGPSAFS
jgi:hypothetical protein